MPNIAVILSGCGYLDGAEIRESVLALLYLDQHKADVTIFAPNVDQMHVVDHLAQNEMDEARNVLLESARIARSQITELEKLNANDFDALVIPGGFGVAKNLSDFATKGTDCVVLPSFADAVAAFHAQNKPIGAICIAPAVLAAALKNKGFRLTIGEDKDTAAAIEQFGHTHVEAPSTACVIDETNKIATCSAYMREEPISEIAQGIEKTIAAVLQMA